ncbi:hypothetical protein GCM10011403_29300 [Pseudohongiella nitratireducens]|uniref:Tll0287-like domain-containing protein n=1 Tax=Pseudohongiella nitratireducens TaxID=1768907 RepID=A0A916VK86_9GAMM|nr:DUF3365 domain-containing protein [Pseudohongiella nitratireducens]GFZ83851.1 hypothetical protein GCM10011403_29300 [Pseudohongiella nitratireducens]|tara:strand:+ start:101 stop:682 length:582 start_codon:yes stop_codon:yes gene_type:complete
MMTLKRLSYLVFTGMATISLASCRQSPAPDHSELDRQASAISQQFVDTLLPTLQSAMATGGPTQAIEICSVRAPQIAAELSDESGWSVRRVSLKPRNLALAEPDSWEKEVLEAFDQRQRAGEAGSTIKSSAVVNSEYRFMQAQPVMPLCLTCHGQIINEEVHSALAAYYPGDMATGYVEGQIRGAISLRTSIP